MGRYGVWVGVTRAVRLPRPAPHGAQDAIVDDESDSVAYAPQSFNGRACEGARDQRDRRAGGEIGLTDRTFIRLLAEYQ
jgi:hypothetical protein